MRRNIGAAGPARPAATALIQHLCSAMQSEDSEALGAI